MPETKAKCTQCGVEIQLWTAERTGGLCMPCKTGSPRPPDPNQPHRISCVVGVGDGAEAEFFMSAQDLLQALEGVRHIGDESHPNKLELEAQRALLRFTLRYRGQLRLHDDHWGRTGGAVHQLFGEGKAKMEFAGRNYSIGELTKEEWVEGEHSLGKVGGFLYRDANGIEVWNQWTWIS